MQTVKEWAHHAIAPIGILLFVLSGIREQLLLTDPQGASPVVHIVVLVIGVVGLIGTVLSMLIDSRNNADIEVAKASQAAAANVMDAPRLSTLESFVSELRTIASAGGGGQPG